MSINNKWEQEQYIGKGAYSEVYRVKLHGKYYALKKIFPSFLKNPIYRENIEREIKIMQSIDHPKIVKLYRTILQDDQISLLIEYASGGSLYDTLKNYGKLPERQVKKYVKDIVEALQYLHTRDSPILHRDIKPENLLIDSEGNCKLADFGSANLLDGQRLSYVGTLGYMAPEVTQCQPHGIPFDNWSLGVLIYELLTGDIPEGQSGNQIIYPPFLSRAVEDVIKKLLIKDPQKRMILRELKEHIWFCEEEYEIKKRETKTIVNKIEQMKKRVTNSLNVRVKSQKVHSLSSVLSKQKSAVEQNEQVTKQAKEYIQLLKEREKLKETVLKNQKVIEKEENKRRMERPFLLQEIDRVKCAIKEYQNNIAILKARPLKTQAQCKHNIQLLGKRIDQLGEYVKNSPLRVRAELFSVVEYEPRVQVAPISDYIYRLKTIMLGHKRDALMELHVSLKTHQQISQMVQIQNEFHMPSVMQEKKAQDILEEASTHNLHKQKQL